MHTLGYPLRQEEFGGAFIYAMPEDRVSLGLVVGLDYRDPLFDPHMAFNRFKQHPLIARLLDGASLVRYGAKALPEGGWNTIPQLSMDGGLIAGDAGGFVNSMRLKGIHLAMRTGMLAADTAFAAVRDGDTSHARLRAYEAAINDGPVRAELYPVRNVHQAFEHGLMAGAAASGLAIITGGRLPFDLQGHPGYERTETIARYYHGAAVPSDAEQCDDGRPPAHVRQTDQRSLFGNGAPRRSTVAPAGAHRRVHVDLRAGIRPSVHALLPGECLRNRARGRRWSAAPDQRLELCALQDVRHHGSVPGHHLGPAGRWGWAAI